MPVASSAVAIFRLRMRMGPFLGSLYLAPKFRAKPLPAAVVAVFVATFSMVSTAWVAFHFVLGYFVKRNSPEGVYTGPEVRRYLTYNFTASYCPCPRCQDSLLGRLDQFYVRVEDQTIDTVEEAWGPKSMM
jgi:hypothetical protein